MMTRVIVPTLLALFMGIASPCKASIQVGDAAIARANADSYSNFSMALLTKSVPTSGIIESWETWAANDGTMALLFLKSTGVNQYSVEFVSTQAVVEGINQFVAGPDFAAATIQAGWILGIWMGDAKVEFDFVGDSTTYTGSGDLLTAPTVGQTINYTGDLTGRTYSINAQLAPVPEPATVVVWSLLGVAASVATWQRRKAV